jgi:two-component system, NtrC family, sensor kinase
VRKRLAAQLILSLTLLVVVVAGVFNFLNLRVQERQLLENMVRGAEQLSNSIVGATWHSMLADHREDAYAIMESIAQDEGIDRIRIYNKEGRVMFSTGPEGGTMVDMRAEACVLCHAEAEPLVKVDTPDRTRTFRGPNGSRKLAMVTPIYNEPACSDAACHAHPGSVNVLGVLDVSFDLTPVQEQVAATQRRSLLVAWVEIGLIAVFIVFFTRRFVGRPIRQLIEGTEAVAAMQLDHPIEIDTSQELGKLAHSFNLMRERLKGAMDENAQFTQSLEKKVEERTAELKAVHQKLITTDRLASLGQLSASVAHEINNPLSGVLNLSMLMQRILKDDGIPPGRIEEFRSYLSQVIQETARVGRIVSDLLAFSRRQRPQSIEADLNQLFHRTVALVQHKLDLMNVEVRMNLQEGLPRVECDPSQIQQVILNLVLNGAEAMHGGGVLEVRTFLRPGGRNVRFEVRDSGAGIPRDNLSKIFDPFFTTKEEGKGVGLGLAVVYGILQAHGGDIEVDSMVGRGTTFRVSLPLRGPAGRAGVDLSGPSGPAV